MARWCSRSRWSLEKPAAPTSNCGMMWRGTEQKSINYGLAAWTGQHGALLGEEGAASWPAPSSTRIFCQMSPCIRRYWKCHFISSDLIWYQECFCQSVPIFRCLRGELYGSTCPKPKRTKSKIWKKTCWASRGTAWRWWRIPIQQMPWSGWLDIFWCSQARNFAG